MMASQQWKKVLDRYCTPEEQDHCAAKKAEFAASQPGFDQEAYTCGWRELNDLSALPYRSTRPHRKRKPPSPSGTR